MTRLGLVVPFFRPLSLDDAVTLARDAEARGYHALWTGESAVADAISTMTVLATHTTRVTIASGVIPVQLRTPQLLGQTALTLGHVAPGRIALGLGVSSRIIVGDWHGLPFTRPLEQLREAVQVIRLVLSGERVSFDGRHYKARNFRPALAPPPRPVKIYLAALGPRMLELAGELADGVLLNWLPPEAVPPAIRQIEVGARRAGRSLADFEVAALIRTTVTDGAAAVRESLARDITSYAIVDSYARFFAGCGYGDEVARVNAAWTAGDRAKAVQEISPRFLDGLGVVGSADFCRDRIAQYAKAGLTQPVIVPFAPGPDAAATVFRTARAFGDAPAGTPVR
jgi:probable F420-dependent oxidoreductase